MGRRAVKPILTFKDMYVINSHQAPEEQPIMSFQTNKNGTFNPSMTIASGVLKWVIDGSTYYTNTPSVILTGATVDVKVYAGSVPLGGIVTNLVFESQNIIGQLDFSWFALNLNTFTCRTNPLLTAVIFSTFNNYSTALFRAHSCNITGPLDLSNFSIPSGTLEVQSNPNMTALNLGTKIRTLSYFSASSCNLTSLDLSYANVSGLLLFNNNPNLTNVYVSSANGVISNFNASFCKLASLDLSTFTFTNCVFRCTNMSTFTTLNLGTNNHTFTTFTANQNNLTGTLDLSYSTINGPIFTYSRRGSDNRFHLRFHLSTTAAG